MRLGDLVWGEIPTAYTDALVVFPNATQALAAAANTSEADQDGWFPNSIGQEAGRYSMRGPLPGRYYGPSWLAPNSGYVPTIAGSIFGQNGAADTPAGAVLDGSAPMGPISIATPLPSVTYPRTSSQTVPAPPCPIATWVSQHPLLAVGAAVLVYFGFAGGRK